MNKKLLALAIAGALAAPLAQAGEVSVYGLAHVSFDAIDGTEDAAGYGLTSRSSRIGVKASEDLGGGLKAIAGFEWGVDVTGDDARTAGGDVAKANAGSNNLTARNQIVGLSGGFGTVALGRHDTPLKMSTGKLDPFSDQLGDYNNIIGNDRRGNDVIAYLSPNFNGFNLNAAIITDENEANQVNALDSDPAATSVALTYGNGPLYLALANEVLSDVDSTMRFGVGYSIAGFGLGFVYQSIDNDVGDSDPTAMHFSATYGMGAATLKAAYGVRDNDASGVDDSTLMAIGVDYALSKATKVYAQYAAVDASGAMQDAYTGVDEEGDQSGLSFGMMYSF